MTTTTTRIDLFGPIHKAIRCAITDLLCQMGTTSFGDLEAASRIARQLEDVTQFCEDHRAHEDRLLLPVLRERAQGTLEHIQHAHDAQPEAVAELRALAASLRTTPDALRPIVGRTLYLHFSTFVAELLLHMAAEEQVVAPLLEKLFTDEELRAIHGQLMATMPMEEKMRSGPWMLRATNAAERAVIEGAMR
jgi:iron-sulfur cluster repair protein YtfE (RIC family)